MEWFRWWHGTVTDPKFDVIARKSGQSKCTVLAVWQYVLEFASQNTNRGSLEDIDIEVGATCLDIDDEAFISILNGMKSKDLIDDECVTSWDKRQPKREDNSTERVKRYRERVNAEKEHETQCNACETQRNADETQRNAPEQIQRREDPPPPYNPPPSGEDDEKSSYPAEFEETWKAYPKREGGNPKTKAFRAWNARCREGHTPQELNGGVKSYAAFVRAKGKEGTEFVMQAATFFGRDKPFVEAWTVPRDSERLEITDEERRFYKRGI